MHSFWIEHTHELCCLLFWIFSLLSNSFPCTGLTWHRGLMMKKKTSMWWKINSILGLHTITVYQWWEYINKMPNNSKVLLRKRHNEKRSLCYKEIYSALVHTTHHPTESFHQWTLWAMLKHFLCSVIKDITISSKHGLQYMKWMSAVPLMIISFCAAERNTTGLHTKQVQPPFCSLWMLW